MDKLIINGGRPLSGEIRISGAKNAVLPALAAAILPRKPVVLTNVPNLKDVITMAALLRHFGAEVSYSDSRMTVNPERIANHEAPYDLVRTMRASFFVLGPLLARLGKARVSLPGGCAIGARPVNLHLSGLRAMGARIEIREGYVDAQADGLAGADIVLEYASVGATENLMMAAALARGTTVISNAAREPEIADLADFINKMGGRISGAGMDTITVEGVEQLGGAEHRFIPDRLEAGTYILLSALCGGKVAVRGCRREHLHAVEAKLAEAGIRLAEDGGVLRTIAEKPIRPADIVTLPHPGFPTDMQAQWMVLMSLAKGSSVIRETVFENRFQHVPELVRMGADISVKGSTAVVRGVDSLKGAPVMVSDLRAGVALVLAGLAAEGRTEVGRIYHLDRGYENLVEKLRGVGAAIERVPAN